MNRFSDPTATAPAASDPAADTGRELAPQPQRITILGAGHFGQIACKRLIRRYPEAAFLVVDSRPEKLAEIEKSSGLTVLKAEGISFLHGVEADPHHWIIPAIPVHVAFLWLLHALQRDAHARALPVPSTVDGKVPNPYRVASGTLYCSFATFRCPDFCSEPAEICTHTKQPRLGNLYEALGRLELPDYVVRVVRSWQLAPGVGGYRSVQLQDLLEGIQGRQGRYLIATSCRCHAVIDALEFHS